MPTLHGLADKTRAFFDKLARRPRITNGDEDNAGYQETQQASRTYTREGGAGSSLTVQGRGPSLVRLSSTRSKGAHVDTQLLPPSAASSPSSKVNASRPSRSNATQGQMYDIPSSPPGSSLDAKRPNPHNRAFLSPDWDPRRIPSSPSLSTSSEHSSYMTSATSNYFSNASGFTIGAVNSNVQNFGLPRTVFEYLEPHVSHGAAHNSDERSDAPKCAPETRRAVQEDIVSWMRDGDCGDESKQIMWLSGPAGSGKTAIAGSVAGTCRAEDLLAGTFFFSSFSGSEDRHSKRCVVATLAHHLAGHPALHEYKVQLLASIEDQPDIFHKCLSEQAQHLLLKPFRTIRERGDRLSWPKGIMLDGLDEVLAKKRPKWTAEDLERAHEDDQVEILEVLHALANDPAFPFRIFVASRPERVITEFFSTTAQHTVVTLFLDSKYKPDADIERFLWSKFSGIRRRCRILNTSWPGQEAVDRIVDMSSGQFIVPATIVRHIEVGVPQRQLDDIMQLKWGDTGRKNPFAIIDALYTFILRRSPEPALAAKWLRVYTSAKDSVSALFFRKLVEDFEGEFHHVLEPLSSLVSIPASGDDNAPLKIYHKSLSDYLSSRHRCGEFHLDKPSVEAFAAGRCVGVLRHKGPTVFINSSVDALPFLNEFYGSALVNLLRINDKGGWGIPSKHRSIFTKVSRSFGDTLTSLTDVSRDELAQCDVAWWTRLCLADIPFESEGFGKGFVYGMYCGIHAHICASGSNPSIPTTCHPACVHWRAGILAEAKALNWCVHKVEQAGFDELMQATDEWFENRFQKMGECEGTSSRLCAICQPVA